MDPHVEAGRLSVAALCVAVVGLTALSDLHQNSKRIALFGTLIGCAKPTIYRLYLFMKRPQDRRVIQTGHHKDYQTTSNFSCTHLDGGLP